MWIVRATFGCPSRVANFSGGATTINLVSLVRQTPYSRKCARSQCNRGFSRITAVAAPSNMEPPAIATPTWHLDAATMSKIFLVACSAAIMAAVSRTSFSMLAIPIQKQFSLSLADMGLIQSSLLFGYILGQVRFSPLDYIIKLHS